ncbi:hypothetical protein [Microlunatus parietis]|uniref:Putative anti-sigma-YlaC factor YlaD n=1 Tax=Microlunatus parietis TaxID=682979 RepID=A0A7Y9LBL7_9ACTN|nr:hypothetical protein [Microlunatus parietis]NYE69961.1 putative anti-sigma-YlaC factor YlaD [Microlunatus parietis]
MSRSTISIHGDAAASGGLAAAIAMMFGCLFPMIFTGDAAAGLVWGAWCAAIGFGGTYAGVFFVTLARRGRSAA